ncbi:Rv3235 family protein [Pseudonocardia nigra]|uniref:Rv3235 family protein n=1 Tax=Pseudonocardia nigra TaxID=1921578 RepID=UPI001C5E2B6F|nr:Rv3235 family protein [Pseudonocardia nigra]
MAGNTKVPVARVLRLIFEVIDGRRPVAQLVGVAAPSVLRYARAARLAGRPTRVSRLLSLRLCRPAAHAVEAAAVVAVDQRHRVVRLPVA